MLGLNHRYGHAVFNGQHYASGTEEQITAPSAIRELRVIPRSVQFMSVRCQHTVQELLGITIQVTALSATSPSSSGVPALLNARGGEEQNWQLYYLNSAAHWENSLATASHSCLVFGFVFRTVQAKPVPSNTVRKIPLDVRGSHSWIFLPIASFINGILSVLLLSPLLFHTSITALLYW